MFMLGDSKCAHHRGASYGALQLDREIRQAHVSRWMSADWPSPRWTAGLVREGEIDAEDWMVTYPGLFKTVSTISSTALIRNGTPA